MSKYPQMLFKIGSEITYEGASFDTKIVNSEAEFEDALSAGWSETTAAAVAASTEVIAKPVELVFASNQAEQLPTEAAKQAPTRADLEAKAAALGVEFGPRVSDKKLAQAIADAEAAKQTAAGE